MFHELDRSHLRDASSMAAAVGQAAAAWAALVGAGLTTLQKPAKEARLPRIINSERFDSELRVRIVPVLPFATWPPPDRVEYELIMEKHQQTGQERVEISR